jgi:hypothetical protein
MWTRCGTVLLCVLPCVCCCVVQLAGYRSANRMSCQLAVANTLYIYLDVAFRLEGRASVSREFFSFIRTLQCCTPSSSCTLLL